MDVPETVAGSAGAATRARVESVRVRVAKPRVRLNGGGLAGSVIEIV